MVVIRPTARWTRENASINNGRFERRYNGYHFCSGFPTRFSIPCAALFFGTGAHKYLVPLDPAPRRIA
jgi:hypothetical protein